MLLKLNLENIALIEIIEINFEKGLNVFTGDSGSGKSLILDSLNVLFGGTNIPLKHLIRPGKENCSIEAKFSTSPFLKNWLLVRGFEIVSSEIFVTRKSLKKNKKIISKYTVNGVNVSKKFLRDLGLLLVDFAGQSDSFLFDSQQYRKLIIDGLGSKQLTMINQNIKDKWAEFQILKQKRDDKMRLFKKKEENFIAKKEMYKLLMEANLNSSQEIIELKSKELRLSNNLDINNSIKLLLNNLESNNSEAISVAALITKSIKVLNKISEFDDKIKSFLDNLNNIQNDLEHLTLNLKEYLEEIYNEENSLEEIQNRLYYLQNLERTFSLDLPKLILKRDELQAHLNTNSHQEEINKLDIQIDNLQVNLNNLFQEQSVLRRETAFQLQGSVILMLKKLGLENANFLIEFNKVIPSSEGIENINFLFSANPDQNVAPLSKVISGGEMSRFLLAIKSSISQKPNTVCLDEIDNGLSGKSLFSLVELIKDIAHERQVLCITHQPCLAAASKKHFKVTKNVINGLTFSSISELTSKKAKQDELVELIGGGFSEVNNYASTLIERAAA